MLDKDTQQKIASCKALQGMTVEDVIKTQRFRDNIAAYLTEQRETRKAAKASFDAMRSKGLRGYKLPSHVCDLFVDMTAEQFTGVFLDVLSRKVHRPFREREYVLQLGQQAYNLTIAQYVIDEFPEMESVFFPKTDAN